MKRRERKISKHTKTLRGKGYSSNEQNYTDRKAPEFIVVFLFFVIGLAILSVFLSSPKSCGNDEKCFLDLANNCDQAVLNKEIEGIFFTFYSNQCYVTKSVEGVAPNVYKKEVAMLLNGRNMKCYYSNGNFDVSLLNSIGGNMDKCSGEYKNVYRFMENS